MLFCCSATFAQQVEPFEIFKLLPGKWEYVHPKGFKIWELWQSEASNSLMGTSWKISESDTALAETIQIKQDGKRLFYIPVVKEQNNGLPVTFTLLSNEHHTYIFENKTHDFPQRIIYQFIGSDKLKAIIEGDIGGKLKQIEFSFVRIAD